MFSFPAFCNYCQKSILYKTEETDIYLEIPNSHTLFLPHHCSDSSPHPTASSTAYLSQGKHFQSFLRQNGEHVPVTGSSVHSCHPQALGFALLHCSGAWGTSPVPSSNKQFGSMWRGEHVKHPCTWYKHQLLDSPVYIPGNYFALIQHKQVQRKKFQL